MKKHILTLFTISSLFVIAGCASDPASVNANAGNTETQNQNENTEVVANANANGNSNTNVEENTNTVGTALELSEDTTDTEIDTSDWTTFNAEENGVNKDVLVNFRYPNNWYTYNIAGGSSVRIFFSDGGHLAQSDKTYDEIVDELYYLTEDEIQNECQFSVVYNGSSNEYTIHQNNKKIESVSKKACDDLLNILKKQVE